MDAIVKEFIEKAQAKEKEARDKHLISLGLIKETFREYSPTGSYEYPYLNYDSEKKSYYSEKKIPVSVTDEEYEMIKKYAAISAPKKEVELDNGAEKFLGVVNGILLAISIIATLALLIVAADTYRGGGYFVLGAISLLLLSLITFASIKVILNVSNNLHQINSKMKE